MVNTKRNIRLTVAGCLLLAMVMVIALVIKQSQPRVLSAAELYSYGAMMLDPPRHFSDFERVDQRGKAFTRTDLVGKWTLMFPGFTQCPDICPTTLNVLDRFYTGLDESERQRLQVVLLSVDPQRDTPQQLDHYVAHFNPQFVGLSGSSAQLLNLATQLSIVYSRVPLDGDNYTMDHSSNIVIINPRGDYHGFFRPPFEEGAMTQAWRFIVRDFSG